MQSGAAIYPQITLKEAAAPDVTIVSRGQTRPLIARVPAINFYSYAEELCSRVLNRQKVYY